ncbi:MAG: PEP-CTERM sorting domain-containing protein [Pirellulales bacterium]
MSIADAGGNGRVAVFGAGTGSSTLDVTNDLYVGNIGLGELFVGKDLNGTADGNGTLDVGSDLFIGTAPGTTEDNKVIVRGENAVATIGASLQAGRDGRGTFEARDGATISVGGALSSGSLPGGDGTIVLDGPDTSLSASSLFLGNANSGANSTGEMTISNGATATFGSASNGVLTLGDDPGATGTVTVTGAGSRLETTGGTAEWWIGGSSNDTGGTGTLNVLDGGAAIGTGRVIFGYAGSASGALNVAGPGSLLDANGDRVSIGFNAVGEATITDGGLIEANTFRVSDEPGATGSSATISGVHLGGDGQPGGGDDTPSRVEVSGIASVGEAARGSLTISAGGQLESNIGVTTYNTNVAVIGSTSATDSSFATVTGNGSSWVHNGWLRVGASGGSPGAEVELSVLDGGYVEASYVEMAQLDGSASKVVVDGADSLLRLIDGRPAGGTSPGIGDIRMVPTGSNGRAEIIVTGGGAIDLDTNLEIGHGDATGSATVSVSGPGSRIDAAMDLSVSFTGTPATLTLEDGGAIQNLNKAFIGRGTALGTATVGAAAGNDVGHATTSWTVGPSGGSPALYIGGDDAGNGLGGTTSAVTGVLNVNPTGTVTVHGMVRVWDRGVVNLDGGTLELEDINLTDSSVQIPNSPTFNFDTGTLRFFDAAGYTLDAARLESILGNSPTLVADQHLAVTGTAVLSAPLRLNGGELSVGAISAASLSHVDFDAGAFTLTGSSLTVGPGGQFGSTIVLDGDETINVVDHAATVKAFASLNVIEGGYTSASTTNDAGGFILVSNTTSVNFDSDGTGSGLTNNGNLIAIDSTIAGSVASSGAIEIVGDVNFTDNLSLLAGGSLGIDLNGLSDFDAISVGGDALLDGVLNVNVTGFSLTAGNSFEIIDVAGSTSGMFAGLADGGLVGSFAGVDLFINYNGGDGNDVVLFTLGGNLPGDGNGDGWVDGLDYLLWAGNFGTHPGSDGDYNDDGWVDGLDYLLWAGSFGDHTTTAVPEPSALFLLLCGLSVAVLRRRR